MIHFTPPTDATSAARPIFHQLVTALTDILRTEEPFAWDVLCATHLFHEAVVTAIADQLLTKPEERLELYRIASRSRQTAMTAAGQTTHPAAHTAQPPPPAPPEETP